MTKRIFAVFSAVVLCFIMSVTAFAADTDVQYISDDSEMYLSSDGLNRLNKYAEYLSEKTGVDILFAYTHSTDFDSFVNEADLGKRADKVFMIENEDEWDIYFSGEPLNYFGEDEIESVRNAYDDPDTFTDSVASYIKTTAIVIAEKTGNSAEFVEGENSFDLSKTTVGPNNTIVLDRPDRMVDMADVLSSSEETALRTKMNELSARDGIDVSIVTVTDLAGKSLEDYANDFYDYNMYGTDDICSGIILVVHIEEDKSYSSGNSWISTTGDGITALNEDGIQFIGKQITPELKKGEYNAAFTEYASWIDDFVNQYRTKGAYTSSTMPKGDFEFGKNILIALGIGIVVAVIVTMSMKKKLKTVAMKASASDYMKDGSLNITASNDVFLYSSVDKRAKPKDNGDSGSSSGSSGRSHGGGGF